MQDIVLIRLKLMLDDGDEIINYVFTTILV